MNTNVMIVGVGGQGSLLASRLLGQVMMDAGYEVRMSEVHGMSQRGGSVVTYVKFGDKVYSPVIKEGEADYIVSFEKLEAARYAHCLKKGGTIIVNDRETDPMPVITGAAEYPHEVLDTLKEKGINVDSINALSMAESAGSSKAVNIVLMGRMSKYFDLPEKSWTDALEKIGKPSFLAINKEAFTLGRA